MMMIFLDSTIFVENYKGNNLLLDSLLEAKENQESLELCYSGIVLNEFLFHYLGIEAEKSPLSVKQSKQIPEIMSRKLISDNFIPFSYLQDLPYFYVQVPPLMQLYNLLPSDAMILAICISYEIKYLATLDSDFKTACFAEGIEIIDSPEKLQEIFLR